MSQHPTVANVKAILIHGTNKLAYAQNQKQLAQVKNAVPMMRAPQEKKLASVEALNIPAAAKITANTIIVQIQAVLPDIDTMVYRVQQIVQTIMEVLLIPPLIHAGIQVILAHGIKIPKVALQLVLPAQAKDNVPMMKEHREKLLAPAVV